MGLLIDKEHPTGLTLKYWNILSIDLSVSPTVNGCNIRLRGYIDKTLRNQGCSEVYVENLHIDNISTEMLEVPSEACNIYQIFYKLIKEQEGWTTAVDDV